jgi:hypothetical protein
MKANRTGRLQHKVTSTRRISVSEPARLPAREDFRSSLREGGFLNLWILFGLAVFFFGLLLATFARSDGGGAHLKISNLFHPNADHLQREASSWDIQADVELDIIVVYTTSGVQVESKPQENSAVFRI